MEMLEDGFQPWFQGMGEADFNVPCKLATMPRRFDFCFECLQMARPAAESFRKREGTNIHKTKRACFVR